MAVLLGFAFLSGVITILSPCILPVLPIVLAAGAGSGKARPFGVIAGFIASFTLFTLTLTALVQILGVPADALRIVAVLLIILSGLAMLVPGLKRGFELLASRLANRGAGARNSVSGSRGGFVAGLPVGLGLGLVWTPCVGPIMASVISLAITQRLDGGAVFITLAYTAGTAIPMLAVMLGGRALLGRVPALARNSGRIQQGLGVLMILMGVAIGIGWDRKLQTAVLSAFPGYGAGLTSLEDVRIARRALEARDRARQPAATSMTAVSRSSNGPETRVFSGATEAPAEKGKPEDFGLAPELVTKGVWFNTADGAPLRMEDLRGKVVLVDFWTYSCVNCVRTIPYLRAWHEAYRDQGLVIIGVHSPEFEFEKSAANVKRATKELRVSWPVVLDNDFEQWNAYGNRYWPAHYFIDAQGRVRYYQFGEGGYDVSERVIQTLLREAGATVGGRVSGRETEITARTPETYLGFLRAQGLVSEERPIPGLAVEYRPSRSPANGEWTLSGRWIVAGEYAVPESTGILELAFEARDVYLVIEPEAGGGSIAVRVDGKVPADTEAPRGGALAAEGSRLYHLVRLPRAGAHLLRLEVQGRLRLFAFTFG